MKHRAITYFFAVGVVAVFCAGIVWAVESEQLKDSGSLVRVSYGPIAELHPFKAPVAGKDGPLGRCVVCHSVKKQGTVRVAPSLWGVVDADKARAHWFGYSSALIRADGSWSETDLDAYLTKPDRFLPGTKKTLIGIPDSKERAAIIAALKKLRD